MKQEDKDLLLKDLCARLPYRVVCKCDNINTQGVLKEIESHYNMCILYDTSEDEYKDCNIFDCRPYLFPLSSMTKEQNKEYAHILVMCSNLANCQLLDMTVEDWFRKNHFDYRGLIEKGLAIDATGKSIY